MLKKKSVMALDHCQKESKNFYLFHNSYQQMNVMQTWRNFRVVRSFNCQCIPHFVFSSFFPLMGGSHGLKEGRVISRI